jgi:anti-sigma B factor antagonist
MNDDYAYPGAVVRSVRQESGATIVTLEGQVDMSSAVELRGAILQAIEEKPQNLLINMTDLDFMDSSGLATLVEALQLSKKTNCQLKLVGLQARVRNVFEISRLDNLFQIFETEPEALT